MTALHGDKGLGPLNSGKIIDTETAAIEVSADYQPLRAVGAKGAIGSSVMSGPGIVDTALHHIRCWICELLAFKDTSHQQVLTSATCSHKLLDESSKEMAGERFQPLQTR